MENVGGEFKIAAVLFQVFVIGTSTEEEESALEVS